MSDIAISTLHVINRSADRITSSKRNLKLIVNIALDLLQDRLLHLVAVTIDELDTIVRIRIMRCANHHAAIKATVNSLVGNAGRRDNMKHIRIGTRSNESRNDSGLEHIARTARVLTDNNTALLVLACAIVPANKSTDFKSMLDIEAIIGFAAKTIGSEVLHGNPLKRKQKQTY